MLNIRAWLDLSFASQSTVGLIMTEDWSLSQDHLLTSHPGCLPSWDGKNLCPLQPRPCCPEYSYDNINCKWYYLVIPQTVVDHWGGLVHNISGDF